MMGLDARTFSSTLVSVKDPPTVAKYLMAYLAETVFPAPDSPLTMMDWFLWSLHTHTHTRAHAHTRARTCARANGAFI